MVVVDKVSGTGRMAFRALPQVLGGPGLACYCCYLRLMMVVFK